jgi:hypothetical protein
VVPNWSPGSHAGLSRKTLAETRTPQSPAHLHPRARHSITHIREVLGDEAYEALAPARATMTNAATATSHSTRSTGPARTDAWGRCQARISGDQGDFLGAFGQCDIGGGVDAPTPWIPVPYRLSTAAEI